MANGMRGRARRTRENVDRRLAEVEQQMLSETNFDWESIRPDLASDDEYQTLMQIVGEATARNESIGQLVNRLKALGSEGLNLLEKVKGFVI